MAHWIQRLGRRCCGVGGSSRPLHGGVTAVPELYSGRCASRLAFLLVITSQVWLFGQR